MPDYQNPRFSRKPFHKGGSDRFSSGPKQMYKAQCSNCNETCEVPFRPNGKKPVFCSNCFKRDEDPRDSRPSYPKREYAPRQEYAPRAAAPQEDRRIDDLKRQLVNMEAKLDRLTMLLEQKPKAESAAPEKKEAAPKAKKAVAKKAKKK